MKTKRRTQTETQQEAADAILQFLEESRMPTSKELKLPGWGYFYVRKTRYGVVDRHWEYQEALVLANINVEEPGQGTFTLLLEFLRRKLIVPLIVECVHDPRFQSYLRRNGFAKDARLPHNFLWMPR